MSSQLDDFKELLRNSGNSVTLPRLAVFEVLTKHEALSMQELYQRLAGQIDRATLYRVIELFEELEIVHRINLGWKYKIELAETFTGHHHHLTCLGCGTVVPINESKLEDFTKQVASEHNFRASRHQFEIQGYCAKCQAKD
ncbi:MAG: Fur family transcriptional regulator, ferric uptake regulator [Patescibacteria group bacterium]|nr:Fur family transcriptional regulator, ferric uptake regulator [Patescibacteria group bacterium]